MPGFDISQRPVRLSVPGQVTGRAVTFSTIRTLTFLVVGCLLRRLLCSYCFMVVVVNIVFLQLHKTECNGKNLFGKLKSCVLKNVQSLKLSLQSNF